MAVTSFDARSQRAVKARWGRALSPWALSLGIGALLLVIAGAALVLIEMPVGWALIGLTAIPVMIFEWHKHELSDVPIVEKGERIDDLMDSDVLSHLPEQPSPQEIATALASTKGGHFFAVRFGVSGGLLYQISSRDRADTEAVWQSALAIARQTGGRVTAGVLILALLRWQPAKARTTLLGHLQLSEDDLSRGLNWYSQLRRLIERQVQRARRPGGIGRDWSFGWIPNLSRFGRNISEDTRVHTDVRSGTLHQLTQALEGGRKAVALVGKPGVGKTQLVHQLADVLMDPASEVPESLRYRQVFMLEASRLIGAANRPGELEELVEQLLVEAYSAKNVIVCLDDAQLFFEEGVGSVDISTLLLPILEAGRLPIILAMDEQRFLQITERTPALASAVDRINIYPTTEADTLRVIQDQLPTLEFKYKVTYMYQALKEAYKLGARYVYDTVMPGQAIALLEAAAQYADGGLVTATSVNKAIEKTTGIKTALVSDEDERDKLLNLEALLHERVVGQERAISVVSDALRRARAGVRNQKRPMGTFLFLGPTGVGKTELAKALASVYFGGEENIIRLDMNEFVSDSDVARLIADGADDPGSLTAQVMKQPFSVILLDEIEKAHSSVLTTFLQLLDEGILRDVRGREVSFRDAIVIATSNAGSDRVQEYLHRGYNLEQFEDTFVNELISSQLFHPEFLNRFDEIVIFAPLSKPELLEVVDLILKDVNKNLAEQKITVTVADDGKEYLVEAGYDPRLGARPMRRVIQRTVESIVAKQLIARSIQTGDTIELSLEDIRAVLDKKTQADAIAKGKGDE